MVDMRHKVTTFIIKNPPTEESSSTAATTPGKKGKRQKGGSAHTNGDASPEVGNGDSKDLTPVSILEGHSSRLNLPVGVIKYVSAYIHKSLGKIEVAICNQPTFDIACLIWYEVYNAKCQT